MSTILKETLRGILLQAKRNCSDRVHTDQMVLGKVRLDLEKGSQRLSKLSKLKVDHQARVSDQIVLVIVRQEAGPRERWPKTFKAELENNSRKPRGPTHKTGIVTAKRKFNLFLLG
jgi:hypothetical protein